MKICRDMHDRPILMHETKTDTDTQNERACDATALQVIHESDIIRIVFNILTDDRKSCMYDETDE